MHNQEKSIARLQKNLSAIRKIIGLTTEDLAKRIGVTKQTISNMENGKTKMTLTQFIAIRSILDYESQTNEQMKDVLPGIIYNLLDNDELSEDDEEKITTSLNQTAAVAATGVTGSGLVAASAALSASIGVASVLGSMIPLAGPLIGGVVASGWIANTVKNANKNKK